MYISIFAALCIFRSYLLHELINGQLLVSCSLSQLFVSCRVNLIFGNIRVGRCIYLCLLYLSCFYCELEHYILFHVEIASPKVSEYYVVFTSAGIFLNLVCRLHFINYDSVGL